MEKTAKQQAVCDLIQKYIDSHSNEFYYVTDISKEIGISVYIIKKHLCLLSDTSHVMEYTGELVYIHLNDKEKQVPRQFLERFIEMGWSLGRCEISKRNISIAEGGDPDKVELVWINDGIISIQVSKDTLAIWLGLGWNKGKIKCATQNRIAIHRSEVDKYVFPEELTRYESEGWIRGGKHRKRTGTVWNKGKTKYTDERLLKVSDNMKNSVVISEETRKKISNSVKEYQKSHPEQMELLRQKLIGREPWNKGQTYKLSEESRNSFLKKQTETKRKNGTFNTSRPEEELYNYLVSIYGEDNIKRQYYDIRYPFHCDFYIVPEDKFIELNLHWTHGHMPFDPEDEFCKKQLLLWEERAKQSDFYRCAIHTWTVKDILKIQTAKNNHLNYEVYYKWPI